MLNSPSGETNTSTLKLLHAKFLGKIYYFKFVENNITKLDLIPVRIGQVGYLFDRVSGSLFGNNGTGTFIIGPDKS